MTPRSTVLHRVAGTLALTVWATTALADMPSVAADQYIRLQTTKPPRLEAFDGSGGRELPGLPDIARFAIVRTFEAESARPLHP